MYLFDSLFRDVNEDVMVGMTSEMKALYLLKRFKKEKGLLVVTNSLYEANFLCQILENYTDDVLLFPMDDFLTSEALAISPEFKYKRLETLQILLQNSHKIIVTNLMGYLRFLPTKQNFMRKQLTIEKDKEYNMHDLVETLYVLGYEKESLVSKTGEMAPRGFVLDIFPVNRENPIRITFWGDTVESIKGFDIDSQLTMHKLEEDLEHVAITSNTEFLSDKDIPFEDRKQRNLARYENVTNITGYMDNPLTVFDNFHDIRVGYDLLVEEMLDYTVSEEFPKDTMYMHELDKVIPSTALYLSDFDDPHISTRCVHYNAQELETFKGTREEINQRLNAYLKARKKVYICVNNRYSAHKILDELENDNIIFTNEKEIIEGKINLLICKMSYGFLFEDYVFISEREIFNKKEIHSTYKTKFKLGTKIRDITKLNVGDYIVHGVHGIGRYAGMKTLVKNGLKKDYLLVEYAGSDKLYIPVEKIDFITKYSSNEGLVPKLNKLGTSEWQKTKQRVKKKIESIAEDLLKLYAERENTKGYAFCEDTKEQFQFEALFPYTPTEDQLKVIEEIKRDMEKERPMDRLVCGDVGFGKTEVAFRAMFKAVMSNKQVVFLCPTTILSQQHFQNAVDRFSSFGVEVALLNRFVTGKKLSTILKRLKEGKIDILIGTHKILGKDVMFKDLGLLVIDEEQRFGVTHKEKIKQYKSNVDVLTLSATPIPRTLQMSMSGLRSLSLLETPPIDRYPVQTYVLAENNQIIKDAIYKELSRHGQAFILYNHVDSIESKAKEMNRLIPDARIIYAHGQMSKSELEDVMLKFTAHEYDILLCTTIIETGIDIPNVNTLIIMDADRFGLSQLYQIRGRVGRSSKIAYCYLMYDKRKILSEIAVKRLKVIKDFTELGSGFAIAVRDLSIRGAGDILGSEQAGYVDSVGVEMFLNMLNEEVEKLKGNAIPKEEKEELPLLEVETSIEDSYVSDEEIKIEIHRKINEIDSLNKLKEIYKELEDRFGKVSESLEIYMYEEWFEKLAKELSIKQIKQTKNSIEISLPKELTEKIDGQKLFMDVSSLTRMFRFGMRLNHLIITLDTVKLDKHFVYYLIDLLEIIKKSQNT